MAYADAAARSAPRPCASRAPGGTDLTVQLGEYPTMSQYGYSEARRPVRPLGRRPRPHVPERGLGQRHRGVRTRATSSCCPIAATCRTRCGSTSATASSAEIEGGLDAKLMSDWLDGNKARPDDMDGHAESRISAGGSTCRAAGTRSRSTAPIPTRHHAGARCFAGNFLFSTGAEFAGRRQAHHQRPLRRADARLHR